jgi:basic amino acid/polyamine antiporter, APA family
MTTYARRLGLFSATMAVMGGIIGGGIFRTPAAVAARVATPGLALAAWILGGVVALAGALCFGELAARYPRAGGGYVYLREAWGPLPAFLYGWALLLMVASGAIAAIAVTFAGYALALAHLPGSLAVPVAVGAIIVLASVNYVGVAPGAAVVNLFTVLKLIALVALIATGLVLGPPAPLHEARATPAPVGNPIMALGAALVPVLFTYGGWQQTNFIAEEIIEPERTLPRALVIGVVVVIGVYLLANVVYLRVLGLEGLATSSAPAAEVMDRLVGPSGATFIAAGIAVSTFGFLDLVLLVTPRVLQAMAADGAFLPRLGVLHPMRRTPAAAIVAQASWACVLTVTGTFAQLVDYVTFGDWIFFALTVLGLYRFRARDRAAGLVSGAVPSSGVRVPGHPWTPAVFVAAAALVVVGAIWANPRNALAGAGLLLLGVPVYLRYRSARPMPSSRA